MKWSLLFMIMLAGCAAREGGMSGQSKSVAPDGSIFSNTIAGTFEGAWTAIQSPFEDINLKQQPIPDKLRQIADNPYAMPVMRCDGISWEIAELDNLLGPDVCTPQNPSGAAQESGYMQQGARLAQQQAVGMVGNTVDVIPFRGVVRSVSGAERHAQEVQRVYQAGKLRRAFLKGLAATMGPDCLKPAEQK